MEQPTISVIAFDADDTLWDCQSHFIEVERQYCGLLADYADPATVSAELFKTETANMPELGYGCKAFTLSLVENAVRISGGRIPATRLLDIQQLGRSLLRLPATPLPEVEATLRVLRERTAKRQGKAAGGKGLAARQMVVFTKGELQDQQNKVVRSGLAPLFDDVVVVADKTPDAYQRLCRRFGIGINQLLAVGNSFKSDVEPVLRLGGYAVHIPFKHLWAHEHTEEYEHDRLRRITRFSELLDLQLLA